MIGLQLDVSTLGIQNTASAWASLLGTDTIVTHHYFNDVSKEEIAVLTFNSAQNAVVKVVYKNTSPNTPTVETPEAALSRLQIHPNPAVSMVTIRCADAPPGVYTLRIFSSLGALIQESTQLLTANTPISLVLPAGMDGLYCCRLEDAKGNLVGTGRLVVIR